MQIGEPGKYRMRGGGVAEVTEMRDVAFGELLPDHDMTAWLLSGIHPTCEEYDLIARIEEHQPDAPQPDKGSDTFGRVLAMQDEAREISGVVDLQTGWIIDYADVKRTADVYMHDLDHHTLNEIPGLENPTCENIVEWLRDKISAHFPGLSLVEVRETQRAGCVWRRND